MSSDSLHSFHDQVVESKRKMIAESSKTPTELPPDKYIFCNCCKGETNHTCKADYCRHHLLGTDKYLGGLLYTVGYRLWMCGGCEHCTLEQYYTDETMEDENGVAIFESEYFPKRTKHHLANKHFKQLPPRLENIYHEVLGTFNNELRILCSLGIRALIEGICADQEITGRNLETRIDGLSSLLPKKIVSNLHSIRFMGNEAAHELNAPAQDELQLAIEICEDLLNYLYELDYKASQLSEVRERRKSTENNVDL